MTDETNIIGIVKELQAWVETRGGKASNFVPMTVTQFKAVAEALTIAVEALEEIENLTQHDADQIDNWQVRKPANGALSRIKAL